MARYLFTTLPTNDLGLLTRSLPIAQELLQRGHSVVFCSPGSAPRKLVAEAGFDNLIPTHPLYELIDVAPSWQGIRDFIRSRRWRRHGNLLAFLAEVIPALPWRSAPATADIWNMDHAGATMGMLNERFVRENCRALGEVIAHSKADVLVDFWNPFAVIAARAARRPVVTLIQADAHPASKGFLWWKEAPANIPTAVPTVNRVLRHFGLPSISKLAELSVGDLTLVVGMPETDPLPPDARVTYVGSLLWQKADARLPDWIAELPNQRPLIWVYSGNPRYTPSGSVLDSEVILRASIEALRDLDVQVVLTTGHHALPQDLPPLPANFRHEAYVPGLLMARRSDLLIHHGGYGSCQTGLYAGKPAVILPTFAERHSNARRLRDAGAAEIVEVEHAAKRKSVRASELRDTVRRVLADRSIAENAQRLGDGLRSLGGAPAAAGHIESFANAALRASPI